MTEWLLKNMPRPKGRYFLDRIGNDGHYEKTNLKWSTPRESARNHRGNRQITIAGKTQTLIEWQEASGVNSMTIHSRIKAGFPERMWLLNGKISNQMKIEMEFSGKTP